MNVHPRFHRQQLLIGREGVERLAAARVVVFGIGGVGSWCAEGLVRSGIGRLTIVDSDLVCVTNINRQVQATTRTTGTGKVDALAQRLVDINPDADIVAVRKVFDKDTADQFDLSGYDYIIDAIDSLSPKVELIIRACATDAVVFSTMGASCRLNPALIRVASIWHTRKCRLGRFVRKRLRKRGFAGDCLCVYSEEDHLPLHEGSIGCGTGLCVCPRVDADGEQAHEWCSAKKQINGSTVHVTGTFGFFLCGLVVQDIAGKAAR